MTFQEVSYRMSILLVRKLRHIISLHLFHKSILLSVLATAVNKLEMVNLADTFITDEQLTNILQQVHLSTERMYLFF